MLRYTRSLGVREPASCRRRYALDASRLRLRTPPLRTTRGRLSAGLGRGASGEGLRFRGDTRRGLARAAGRALAVALTILGLLLSAPSLGAQAGSMRLTLPSP